MLLSYCKDFSLVPNDHVTKDLFLFQRSGTLFTPQWFSFHHKYRGDYNSKGREKELVVNHQTIGLPILSLTARNVAVANSLRGLSNQIIKVSSRTQSHHLSTSDHRRSASLIGLIMMSASAYSSATMICSGFYPERLPQLMPHS